ncbi:MAG: hypothetical protein QM705_02365 [Ancrocorticia sp.]
MFPSREDTVSGCVRALVSGPPPRILAIDGRSGAGKTTLAREIEARLAAEGVRVALIEVENFIEGWEGLVDGVDVVASEIAAPFRECGCAQARAWDWYRGVWGAVTEIGPADVLLIVGCGSSSEALAPYLDVSVWVEAPEEVRRARVAAREGDPAAWWELWAAQEERLLEQRDSRRLADYVV